MNPSDLALPAKFSKWRPNQLDAILSASCSDTRFTILNMPPGLGKSPAYMAISQIVGGRTLVLTRTKGLQDQLIHDFEPMGLVQIKGQNNYPCIYLDTGARFSAKSPTCDDGPCHAGVECELEQRGCYYYDSVRQAGKSELVVTNYQYWMSIQRFADPDTIGEFDTLVLDEAHDAANTLAEFVRINIVRKDVSKVLKIETPHRASLEEWVEWADEALPLARARLESAKNSASMSHHWMSSVRHLLSLTRSLENLSKAGNWRRTDAPDPPAWVPGVSTDWIVEETDTHATFQPVWASGYAEEYLFAKVPRVILVSATVTAKDAEYLGIPSNKESLLFKSYPSPFKKSNRPVFYLPTVKVGRNMGPGEDKIWMNRIDLLIEREAVKKNQKGLIHAVSYERARKIKENSKYKDIIVIHDSCSTRQVVNRFKNAPPPLVLVSPAISTGWDFPDEVCRFQIIAKLPFIDSRPAVIKARHKSDKKYLDYVTAVSIIQMAGRGVRSEKDWARTYIIDDNWSWFFAHNKSFFPPWFKSAIRTISASEL